MVSHFNSAVLEAAIGPQSRYRITAVLGSSRSLLQEPALGDSDTLPCDFPENQWYVKPLDCLAPSRNCSRLKHHPVAQKVQQAHTESLPQLATSFQDSLFQQQRRSKALHLFHTKTCVTTHFEDLQGSLPVSRLPPCICQLQHFSRIPRQRHSVQVPAFQVIQKAQEGEITSTELHL